MTGQHDHLDDRPTEDGQHPLYAFLLVQAGQDPSDLAIVQTAVFHRPVLDDLEIWTCPRCSWCRSVPGDDPGAEQVVHQPVSAYAPCEQLRLLAWPFRKRFGFQARWMPEEVVPTNPPTLLGGTSE